ncbi:unnamed protein product, partial [Meganyctiphanes norvegica]
MSPLVSPSLTVTQQQVSPSPPTVSAVTSLLPSPPGHTGGSAPVTLATMYSSAAYPDGPSPYPGLPTLGGEQSAFYSPAAASLELKDSLAAAASPMAPTWPYPSVYYPYDTALASYPFAGYGMGLDAARRKNATREATGTLKAWLNEHKKNPYPTKGEKIMLAIITKMTLTQVSTWFANARRRLKKENKMTWEPRSKTDEDDDEDDDKDDDDEKINVKDDKLDDDDHKKDHDKDGMYSDNEDKKKDDGAGGPRAGGSPGAPATDVIHPKPRIWSLADMATSGGLSGGGGGVASLPGLGGPGKILGGGLTRGLHLEGSPYSRPMFPHASYPYIPHSVSESLLNYTYTKSLAAGFPHASLPEGLIGHLNPAALSAAAPNSLVQDLARHHEQLSRHHDALAAARHNSELIRTEISRPEALRPELLSRSELPLSQHLLSRPET